MPRHKTEILPRSQRGLPASYYDRSLADAAQNPPRRGGLMGRAIDFLIGPPVQPVRVMVGEAGELDGSDYRVTHEQYPVIPLSGWTAEGIQDALDGMKAGQFNGAELLYHSLKSDPRIGAALDLRAAEDCALELDLEIPTDSPPAVRVYTEGLQKDWRYFFSEGTQAEAKKRTIMFGVQWCRIDWTVRSAQKMPRLKAWSHSNASYDWSRRQYQVQSVNGPEWVPPDGDGKTWVVFSLGGERPYLEGAILKLGFTWFNIIQTMDRWLELNDEFAEPLKGLKTPALRRESPETAKMWAVVDLLRGGDTVLLPDGYDLKLHQASAQGYETFKAALLDLWYVNVDFVLKGRDPSTTNGRNGKQSGPKQSSDIAHALVEWDARVTEAGLTPVAPVWIRAQFGYEDEENFPGLEQSLEHYAWRPKYNTKPPEDQFELARTQTARAQAMSTFAKAAGPKVMAKLPIDWRAGAESCGWPMKEGDDEPEGDVTPADVAPPAPKMLPPAGSSRAEADEIPDSDATKAKTQTLDGRRVAARGKSQRLKDMTGIASIAAFNPAGQLLMGRRRDSGKWTMPGGHLEPGEGAAAGAARELQEEAGLSGQLAHIGSGSPRAGILVHCFRLDGVTVEPSSAADPDEEVDEWEWLDLPLAASVAANLHAPRNVTLTLIGHPAEAVEIFEAARVTALLAERRLLLLSGSSADGLLAGQAHIDDLAAEPTAQPGLPEVLAAIDAATSWADLRHRLAAAYQQLDIGPRADQLEHMLALAEAEGARSVDLDLTPAERIEVDAADRAEHADKRRARHREDLQRQRDTARRTAAAAGLSLFMVAMRRAGGAIDPAHSLDEARGDIADAVRNSWGTGGPQDVTARSEPLQLAFAHSRARRLGGPSVMPVQPYWRMDVILDGGTSAICYPLARVVLPAHHPWWATHTPPLHWDCRTHIRGLGRAEGERLLTAEPPEIYAQPGFGSLTSQWMPSREDVPAEMWEEFERKAGGQ